MVSLDVVASAVDQVCRRYGVAHLDLFGSFARGEERPDSDVDLLHQLADGVHLGREIEDLEQELADILGRSVDLVSRAALHPLMREAVLSEARVFYVAA